MRPMCRAVLFCVVAIVALIAPLLARAQMPGEREIQLQPVQPSGERESPLELLGLRKPEIGGIRISAFLVGSFNFNSHLQIVPEFAGGAAALADPGSTNFRFDKFGLSVAKTFAPWLSASASIEVENHRDRHTHLIPAPDPNRRGCPIGRACERFGAEEAATVINLDKFHLTGIAPLGNGLALAIGRFDVPFGIERHDEPLLLTATTSKVFRFGRPERMTGFQVSYPFAPWLDVSAWIVNRWENEVTGEDDMNDNNRDKSFGGRVGFTPFARDRLLNIGIGGFWGPEQDDVNAPKRWVLDLDFTWSPLARLLFAGEIIYGGEDSRAFRERGLPMIAAVIFLTEFTVHGPVRVAVGLGSDGKVRDARVAELTEETYPWLKPLIDQDFTRDYAGKGSQGRFGLSERFLRAGLDSMPQFYAQIVASLIHRAAILFDVTVLKRGLA
jgi:Putative beta-barrel porin-2, OmpL-like. bbp2